MYPTITAEQAAFFQEHGWIALSDAVPPSVIASLAQRCQRVHEQPGLALDWSQGGGDADQVLQSMLELVWIDWQAAPFAVWTRAAASALLGREVRLWYNQLLDKPPLRGAPTWWHQDGALLGATAAEHLISCWMALDAVDEESGCMHFLDKGHQSGILAHQQLSALPCSRGACEVSAEHVVACPLPAGGVTFHLGTTPHMTLANRSPRWRQVVIQRFWVTTETPPGQGDYPDARTASM